jgi:hypothetical protein
VRGLPARSGGSGDEEQLVACQPTPEEYRGIAEHIRRKAEPMSNSGAREEMLHIAEQYEQLADRSMKAAPLPAARRL